MRVLMLSTDRNIFQTGSLVRSRMVEYGRLVEELHIVVFASGASGFKKTQLDDTTWVYPTNSYTKLLYMRDALKLAKTIVPKEIAKKNVAKADHTDFHALRELYEGRHDDSTPHVSAEAHAGKWLVTAQDPFETGRVGVKLKQSYGVPLHIQVHTDFLSAHFAKRSTLNKARVVLARSTLPQADCIRTVSERIKRALVESGIPIKTNPSVLPIYVPRVAIDESAQAHAQAIRAQFPGLTFRLLMLGRLAPEKDFGAALAALKAVVAKHPTAGMIIVGDGPEKGRLERLVKKEKLEQNVFFVPWTQNTLPYYLAADALLVASRYEGYSMILIEAAIAGTPIVTTDVGIAGELFENEKHAFICSVGNAECLARRALELIEHTDIRERLKVHAREVVDASVHEKSVYLRRYKESWAQCFGG